ncbi:tachylectin-related carbohydrate-binding protein [Umezawaea beigongshangensis]|uniref:tachylectin-related carbohydrate-binding protein n=1 Tax=Umezawaea beigongshangensis TaxID=2780383 RepID=UPI0018F1CE66|nr:tachylectin-related carbohydrate-binding protein [Umezawaea beigongshangensis]
MRQYFHDDPITGSANWTPEKRIAVGWTGRVLAGPDGLVYNIMGNGELRRFRWNGTTFDVAATSRARSRSLPCRSSYSSFHNEVGSLR